jgi:tetratricopeptide (TPR) repeat protein
MTKNIPSTNVNSYVLFGSAYIDFLESKDASQYLSVISNLSDPRKIPEEFLSDAFELRGISRYKLGGYSEAIEDLEKSYKMQPYIDDLYFIGKCYYGLQDYKTAYLYFNKVDEGTQNLFFRGLANFEMGEINFYETNYNDALMKYIESVNYYSKNPVCTFKIAKCLEKLRYNRLSPKFYKTSLRITNDYASAWFFLNIN